MNASYQGVIGMLFPNAKIIIDRFHIVQLMTRAMNKTRVKVMQASTHQTRRQEIPSAQAILAANVKT